MADELVQQSVFDRLIGADRVEELIYPEPTSAEGEPKDASRKAKPVRPTIHRRRARTWDESVEVLRRNVLRDLEQLLNTRQISDPAGPPYEQLERSAYNYGLRDLGLFSADSAATPHSLQRMIETAIALFEPRIMEPRVNLVPAGGQSRHVRFIITGTLRTDPDPERIEFDTVLEVSSKRFEVTSRVTNAG